MILSPYSIKSIEDMSGKKVGTQTSCYNEDDTKKFNEKLKSEGKDGYAELLKYDSFPEAFAELKNGKIDLVAQNYASCAAVVMKKARLKWSAQTLGYHGLFVRKTQSFLTISTLRYTSSKRTELLQSSRRNGLVKPLTCLRAIISLPSKKHL